jgi:hypothetical protein
MNDLMKEVLKMKRGSLTVKVHEVFKTAIEEWRALIKSYRNSTMTRLFRDVFSTTETIKLNLTLCFDKDELPLLTHKDMTFTVHSYQRRHAVIERKTSAEIMSQFEDMLFNVQVCCSVIKLMHNKFWVTHQLQTYTHAAVTDDESSLLALNKAKCVRLIYKDFVHYWKQHTTNVRSRTQSNMLKMNRMHKLMFLPSRMFQNDRKEKLE